jgi:hypothetical protein
MKYQRKELLIKEKELISKNEQNLIRIYFLIGF